MRLIDADELVRDLMEEIPLAENVHIFKDIIDNQPTAYDIARVVEELENECISPNDYPGYVVDLEKAIEIVKQQLKEQNE